MSGSDDSAPARRRRNPERTRAAILSAATAEFAGRGIEGASVNAIARAANINKRMLYHYFESKAGLYGAVLEEAYRQLGDAIAAVGLPGRAPADAVAHFVTGVFDHVVAHPEIVRLTSIENVAGGRHLHATPDLARCISDAFAALETVLVRGADEGTFRASDPLQVWMTIFAVATYQVSHSHTTAAIIGRDPLSSAALAARRLHVVEVVLAALRP